MQTNRVIAVEENGAAGRTVIPGPREWNSSIRLALLITVKAASMKGNGKGRVPIRQ